MTEKQSGPVDDFSKLLLGLVQAAQGMREEAGAGFRTQLEKLIAELNLVTREEFDVVKDMASRARLENEDLQAQIDALQAALAQSRTHSGSRSRANPSKQSGKPPKTLSTGKKPKKS